MQYCKYPWNKQLVNIVYQVNKQWCCLGETETDHKQKFVDTPFSNERGGGVYLNNPGMLSSGCRHSIQSYDLAKQPSTVNFLASGIEYKAALFRHFLLKQQQQQQQKRGGGGGGGEQPRK